MANTAEMWGGPDVPGAVLDSFLVRVEIYHVEGLEEYQIFGWQTFRELKEKIARDHTLDEDTLRIYYVGQELADQMLRYETFGRRSIPPTLHAISFWRSSEEDAESDAMSEISPTSSDNTDDESATLEWPKVDSR